MLSEQAILTEQLTANSENMPLGFIISDDGRTLLAVTERDDGVLEFMSVPVTIQQSNNMIMATPMKTNEGNSLFQITLEEMAGDNMDQQPAADFPSQGYEAPPVANEAVQLSYAPKDIQVDAPSTVLLSSGSAESNALQLDARDFEIFKVPAPPATPAPTAVVKRSPGRPRKDGSTPPSTHPNNLKCKICGKGFTRLMLLRRHTQQHAEEKPHRCPKCPASFNVPTNFTLHMATHNIGEPKCPECGRQFARMASLKSHMLMHEKEENLFCTECEDAFTTKAQLDAHLKLHNEKWTTEDVRKCKLCNKQFTQPALYRLHIREHYRLQTKLVKQTKKGVKQKTMYKCKICLKSFQKPSQLVRHIRVHTGEKPFQCTICARAFTQKGSLQIHMWKHNGFRPHNCSSCNAKFSQKGNLNAHILRVHNVPDGKPYYKCTHCPCTFKKLGSLNAHMKKMHSNPEKKPQNCDSSTEDMQATVDTVMSQLALLESSVKNPADSTANNPSNKDILQQALKNSGLPSKDKEPAPEEQTRKKGEAQTTMVTLLDSSIDSATRKYVTIKQRSIGNIRWYTCSYCYKEFKKPSDLIRHLRIHTQEKPFKCSYCSRSFAVKSTMIAHEKTHTGVKKYMCCNCNKMFTCHSSLTTHMRVHLVVKPFTCSICDKSFKTNNVLKNHMKSHAKRKIEATPEAEVLAPSIVLEEPLIITDAGNKISIAQIQSKHQQVYNSDDVARPHKCWVCPAAFRKISHLKQHYRRHTGERPYKCQKCNRRFSSNSVLKSHLLIHEGSRPYNCSMCNAKFSTQSSMKRHLATHSNKRPFMCPYCHKTFKTSVNCRKHMKIHKHEIAQQQLHQAQSHQQEPHQVDDKPGITVLSENITLPEELEVTFQPQMAPDFSQAFSDQFHTMAVDKDKTLLSQNNPIQTMVNQTLPAVGPINLESSQTLHADETGTITLPNYSGDQTLTPESIREIEETLNQQLFNIGMNLGLGGNLTRQISETTPNSLEQREQPILNIIYENPKTIDPPAGAAINTEIFSSQFDSFDMSHISLQADNEMGIGITPANSTSMASILPRSAQEEQHLVSVTTTTSMPEDNQSKQPRHLMVVSSMQTCPELSRPVQACPKYPKVIAKADTTDGLDVQSSEETTKNSDKLESLMAEKQVPTVSYKCKTCDKSFQKPSQLRTHKKIHALEISQKPVENEIVTVTESGNLLQCHMCNKTGLTAIDLKDHLKTHKGTKEFQCTECPLKFCTNGGLSRHLKIHTNKTQWKCATCDLTFQNKTQLLLHEEFHENSTRLGTVEPDSSQKEPLTIDGNYIVASELRTDGNSTISEKVLMDAVAEKDTLNDSKKDTKVYTNKCKYCPKTFRKPSDLVRHIRTHTGERPYQCEYCNKCFAVKCTLDCHMKVHTGKKTFSCHVCNSLFTTKGSLKVHMRLHTGSKPFKCPSCDLRFRTSGHRKVHLLTHMREHKDPSKPKPKLRKVAAIAKVAAELERTVVNAVNTEPVVSQAGDFSNIDSITIDANTLTDNITPHITFNADGTILNNNAMLSLNESNQFVANLHFLLANGLVTIQTDDPMLQQLPDAETNVMQSQATVEELIESQSLSEQTESLMSNPELNDSSSGTILYETDSIENAVNEPHGTLELNHCMEMGSPDEIASLSDAGEGNPKLTIDKGQFRRECDVCGKTFLKPCQVERHKRIHTGERPFKCNLCSKSFTQKNTLKMHQKHHTGDRPHQCPHCDYSFSQKGNLKTHLKRAHQLDTLEVKKLRRGQHVLSAKITQDSLEEGKIISLDDISFANIP